MRENEMLPEKVLHRVVFMENSCIIRNITAEFSYMESDSFFRVIQFLCYDHLLLLLLHSN